jgi:hypothetical protein
MPRRGAGNDETVQQDGLDVVVRNGLDDALQHAAHPGSRPLVDRGAQLLAQERVREVSVPRHGGPGAGVEHVDDLQRRAQRTGEPGRRLDGAPRMRDASKAQMTGRTSTPGARYSGARAGQRGYGPPVMISDRMVPRL